MEEKRSGGGCLKAFLILLVILVGLALIGGYLVYQYAGGWIRAGSGALIEGVAEQVLEEGKFSPAERERIMKPINELTQGVRSGEVGFTEMAVISERFISIFGPIAWVRSVEVAVVPLSGLSPEEKAEAATTLSRLNYGIAEGLVTMEDIGALFKDISARDASAQSDLEDGPGTSVELRQNISDEELRSVIAQAEELAERSGIPEDVRIDYAKVVERIISEAK